MNDLQTRLAHIVASKPELLKNLNISIPRLWMFVDHLIANGIRIPVLCKECKHTETDGSIDPAIYCKKWDRWEMPKDFFCSYGERKDNE